ncbi:ATP synthase subunit b [Paenibacillus sp. J31TS4]|uniref:F0F1 ATP synthase subunit B n=1 Tax=Paenibacillus sp. J31TS4 TaxID=2807195 RepID=UPI001B0457E4|nr:F0F1 ATP synthase subunit B [Paenibacillus sp. J31TS4]GIP40938.1 ATP synthase subunit b [Paenibacillus sp. J31TS4]
MSFHWESLVFAMLAFLILYWLLNKYAFGPLFGIMEQRRKLVQDQLQSAEQNRTQSEQLLAEQKQAIEEARKEAYSIIEQAKQTSTRQADEIMSAAKAEANRLKEEAVKEIENEKNKAVGAVRSQVSGLAVMIASKIIEKQVDAKAQEELIDQYLNEVGGKQ